MTEHDQLETTGATIVTKLPKGVCLADYQKAYLNPTMMRFENVEIYSRFLLKMISNVTMLWMTL